MRELSDRHLKIVVFLFPLALYLLFLGVKVGSPDAYTVAIDEDSAIEYAQASFFLLAGVFSLLVSRASFKNGLTLHSVLFAALGVGLLLASLEEVSWGQRVFGVGNPVYFEQHNMQGETTLHNLDTTQPLLPEFYALVGLYGAVAWIFVRRVRTKGMRLVDAVVPDWYLSSYFVGALVVYVVFVHLRPYGVEVLGMDWLRIGVFLTWRDQEPAELLLSLGLLLFVLVSGIKFGRRRLSRAKPSSGASSPRA